MEHEFEILKGKGKLINDHFQNFKTYGIPRRAINTQITMAKKKDDNVLVLIK